MFSVDDIVTIRESLEKRRSTLAGIVNLRHVSPQEASDCAREIGRINKVLDKIDTLVIG
jgi:hypothetical protein